MDYLTNFYKNRAEQLQEQVKFLEAKLSYLLEETDEEELTTSGRKTGIGSGKTALQPDSTWDEVAAEYVPSHLKHLPLSRKNGKVYAGDIELSTASSMVSGSYADNAPTRSQIKQQQERRASAKKPAEPVKGGADPDVQRGQFPIYPEEDMPKGAYSPKPRWPSQTDPTGGAKVSTKVPGVSSAVPTKKEVEQTQKVADETGKATALPTNVRAGTMGLTDEDGRPISVSPTPSKSEKVRDWNANAAAQQPAGDTEDEVKGGYKYSEGGYAQSPTSWGKTRYPSNYETPKKNQEIPYFLRREPEEAKEEPTKIPTPRQLLGLERMTEVPSDADIQKPLKFDSPKSVRDALRF